MQEKITSAYKELQEAIQAHAQAAVRKMRAQEALEEAIAAATERLTGRNREERNAKARLLFGSLFRELAEAEEAYLLARARLEVARARVEELNLILKLNPKPEAALD